MHIILYINISSHPLIFKEEISKLVNFTLPPSFFSKPHDSKGQKWSILERKWQIWQQMTWLAVYGLLYVSHQKLIKARSWNAQKGPKRAPVISSHCEIARRSKS